MRTSELLYHKSNRPKLAQFPGPAKALVTATICVMGIALFGALGQIIVHDIIPTFFAAEMSSEHKKNERHANDQPQESAAEGSPAAGRGDLFSDLSTEDKETQAPPFYKDEQFVWLLKWSHIHLFGMNMIFIFMGAIAIFLDIGDRKCGWLVMMPFIGILVDISAMWLKVYISPIFFWLHIPGGGLFMAAYMIVSVRALLEMWAPPSNA